MQKAKKMKKNASASSASLRRTVEDSDVQRFEALAAHWWDEDGPLKPLHMLNPVRLGYIKAQACKRFHRDGRDFQALQGLKVADIGCGGGLVAEPLCRMGAEVTAIDAGPENIRFAERHSAQAGLKIDYRAQTAEELAAKSAGTFDIVTALEIVEHVADVELFLSSCCKLVKKGGLLILSTLNRTPKAYLLGILAAERVLGWVPPGTHEWKKFLKPSELAAPLERGGLETIDVTGMIYKPLTRKFALNRNDLDVNYLLTAQK